MPIVKRLSAADRLDKLYPLWRRYLRHPLLSPLVNYGGYDDDAANIERAIAAVKNVRGASFEDRVFVVVFHALHERVTGQSIYTRGHFDRTYNGLRDKADELLAKCGLVYHGVILWDMPALLATKPGTLKLPDKVSTRLPQRPSAVSAPHKRRKLAKHT